jgi:hypothetical protein
LEDYRPIDFGYGGGRRAADLDFGAAAAACVRACVRRRWQKRKSLSIVAVIWRAGRVIFHVAG